MNDKDFFADFEKTIKNTVNDIRMSGDFQNLKRSASDLGNMVSNEIVNGMKSVQNTVQNSFVSKQNTGNKSTQQTAAAPNPVIKKPPYRTSGVLLTVFGSILMSIGILLSLIFLITFIVTLSGVMQRLFFVTLITSVIGVIMLCVGISKIKKDKRYKKYAQLLTLNAQRSNEYMALDELAQAVKCKPETVREDLNDMMDKNLIVKAVFDKDYEYIFFSEEVYKLYLSTCEQQAQREKEEAKKVDAQKNSKIISDGFAHLETLGSISKKLSDPVIRQKTSLIYDIASKIMDFITNNPQRADEIKKFSSYYLPSAANILKTYLSFEDQGVVSDDILKTKDEISEMLDVLASAFKKVLDSLYDDDTLDVSTDISAMKAMMAQEGLIDSFDVNSKNKK